MLEGKLCSVTGGSCESMSFDVLSLKVKEKKHKMTSRTKIKSPVRQYRKVTLIVDGTPKDPHPPNNNIHHPPFQH